MGLAHGGTRNFSNGMTGCCSSFHLKPVKVLNPWLCWSRTQNPQRHAWSKALRNLEKRKLWHKIRRGRWWGQFRCTSKLSIGLHNWKIWGRNLSSATGEEENSTKECEEDAFSSHLKSSDPSFWTECVWKFAEKICVVCSSYINERWHNLLHCMDDILRWFKLVKLYVFRFKVSAHLNNGCTLCTEAPLLSSCHCHCSWTKAEEIPLRLAHSQAILEDTNVRPEAG